MFAFPRSVGWNCGGAAVNFAIITLRGLSVLQLCPVVVRVTSMVEQAERQRKLYSRICGKLGMQAPVAENLFRLMQLHRSSPSINNSVARLSCRRAGDGQMKQAIDSDNS